MFDVHFRLTESEVYGMNHCFLYMQEVANMTGRSDLVKVFDGFLKQLKESSGVEDLPQAHQESEERYAKIYGEQQQDGMTVNVNDPVGFVCNNEDEKPC